MAGSFASGNVNLYVASVLLVAKVWLLREEGPDLRPQGAWSDPSIGAWAQVTLNIEDGTSLVLSGKKLFKAQLGEPFLGI